MATKAKTSSSLGAKRRLILKKSSEVSLLRSSTEKIFQKSPFPSAPGGDRYEWKEAETIFKVPKDGLFAIKIEASAKNVEQNRSTDDDDLRVALDGFDFGKYEVHDEQVSWKGFGTSASFDGASLKGGTKTIYFFVELGKGSHTLQFFADQTPHLKTIEVSEVKNHEFELAELKPTEPIKSDIKGIPWISFVFLGSLTKTLTLGVRAKSATSKKTTDGDNLKVVVNGTVLQNPVAPTSDRYKNFYFSGNLKETDVLTITHEQFSKPLAFENAVELWYDEEPEIISLKIKFFDDEEFLKYLDSLDLNHLKRQVLFWAYASISYFLIHGHKYSAEFLKHALKKNPEPLIFRSDDPIIKLIKKDPVYLKIIEKLRVKIADGSLEGEIWPADFKDDPEMNEEINLNSEDLATALHGIRKVEYRATQKKMNHFEIKMVIFDVYDFHQLKIPRIFFTSKDNLILWVNNRLNRGERAGIINNFEIEIHLYEILELG